MSTFQQFAPLFQILLILLLAGVLIRRKLTGRGKRPWSFRVAMGLLGLALALSALAWVLRYLGL